MSKARIRRFAILLVGLALVPACRKRMSAEDQIREAIAATVEGVRQRKVKRVVAVVSSQYSDTEGRNRQAIVDLVRAQVLLRPNLYIVTRVTSVACPEPGQCDAQVLAAMASVPMESLPDLAKSQADVYRFELAFVDEDGIWRVRSATWAEASVKDLL